MLEEAQAERQKHLRRPRILSNAEEEIILHQAKERRKKGKVVDIHWTKKIIDEIALGRVSCPSYSFITKFWQRHKWSNRRAYQRTPRESRSTLKQEISECIERVESYIKEKRIPSSNVFMMDETGLWNGSVSLRTYVDPETCDASIIKNCRKERDTGVVAISASGVVFPYFLKN